MMISVYQNGFASIQACACRYLQLFREHDKESFSLLVGLTVKAVRFMVKGSASSTVSTNKIGVDSQRVESI